VAAVAAVVLRGDAGRLPLPDASVDLIVTSPPYWALRSYSDNGQHYEGQIGSEETPGEYIANLLRCTAEWTRVLKPSGSMFVNLGDKYSGAGRGNNTGSRLTNPLETRMARYGTLNRRQHAGLDVAPAKSLIGMPWRYAIGCIDDLGLILRAEIIWAKPNGLPESVGDRVRRAHEQVFHFTKQPRYYTAIDEIREPYSDKTVRTYPTPYGAPGTSRHGKDSGSLRLADNPLGKLPGSVWEIPSAPLTVPPHLGVDHFAAFPPALVRPIILGWSPPAVCTACGQGRRPVVSRQDERPANGWPPGYGKSTRLISGPPGLSRPSFAGSITGYACACPGTTAPATPAVVLDPFGGTGTAALVADVLGRTGISVDRSADYCRLAQWRTADLKQRERAARKPGQRAKAPRKPPAPAAQGFLFG
jgi:DNA modification methylase